MKPTVKILIVLLIIATNVYSQKKYDFIVAKDGKGDFITIQDAFDAVPHLRKNRTYIFVKNGTYKEKLILPSTKTNVSLIGESANKTIITYDDYASKKNIFGENVGTSGSSSFFVFGDGFYAENITFENSSGPVGQAVAVRVDGDKVFFKNCRFLGFQDTLYPHGEESRQYYKNCYIEGTVDFIFGWSTALFDSCEIYCKGNGYITAASTDRNTEFGFVFLNCTVKGESSEPSHYLGRPWRPYSYVAFINCDLGPQIKQSGWNNWSNPENEKTARYSEYENYGPGSNIDSRVGWSRQLAKEEADSITMDKIFKDWTPIACSK